MRAFVSLMRGIAGLFRLLADLVKHPAIFAIVVAAILGIVVLCILVSAFRKTGHPSANPPDDESQTDADDLSESDDEEPDTAASGEHGKRRS